MKKFIILLAVVCIAVSAFVMPIAMADEVITTYDFQGSNFYAPFALFRTPPLSDSAGVPYDPVVFSKVQFAFKHEAYAENIDIFITYFQPVAYSTTGFWDYGFAISSDNLNMSIPVNNYYTFHRLALPDSDIDGSSDVGMYFAVKCEPAFSSDVVKINFGSKNYAPLDDWTISGYENSINYAYNYVRYTDRNGYSCTIAWCPVSMNFLNMGNDTGVWFPHNFQFTPREYYLNTNFTDNELYDQGFQAGLGAANAEEYNNGYQAGLTLGTQQGFENGYQAAINDQAGDLATLGGFGNFVLSLLDINIFGSFGLGDLLAVAAGGAILFFVFRIIKQ